MTEARATLSRVVAIRSRVLGVDHPQTLRSQQNLASVLALLGESQVALAAQREVLAARRRTLGPDHPDALLSQESLASMHRRAGRLGEAGREAQAALVARERVLGADHPQSRNSRFQLADILAEAGQLQRAQTLLSGLVDQQRSGGTADDVAIYRYALRLYQVHTASGDSAAAEALRRELLEPLLARDPDSLDAALRRQRTEVQLALPGAPRAEGADGGVAGTD